MNIESTSRNRTQIKASQLSFLFVLLSLGLGGCLPSPPPGPPPSNEQPSPPSQESLNQAVADAGGFSPGLCEPASSYARGMRDAKAGKEMNLSFLKLCSTTLKEGNESQYKKGYAEGK